MTRVRGSVEGTEGGSYQGHRVELLYSRETTVGESVLTTTERASAALPADGEFVLEVPELSELAEPIEVRLLAPSGELLGARRLTVGALESPIVLRANPVEPLDVPVSSDPTLGQSVRLVGRVVESHGREVPPGLPVILWGVASVIEGEEPPPAPLLVTDTANRGAFAGPWPSVQLARAFGTVKGSQSSAVPLDEDGRLPTRVLLLVNLDGVAVDEDEVCACDTVPPRAPEPDDLAASPESFSQDLGGGCVDLTTPNRVLEEFSYFSVVRTTEPEIAGLTIRPKRELPPGILDQILRFSKTDPVLSPAAPLPITGAAVAKTLKSGGRLTFDGLQQAATTLEIGDVADLIRQVVQPKPGRTELGPTQSIDWDDTPTIYQATTVAHGHVLQYRQVWRADGYSLGDLLYSLPLAPGQKRQIALVDWERRTTSERTEALDFEEQLDAFVNRDRDISEIVGSRLSEETSGGSRTKTWGVAGGIGAGFIGSGFGIFGGVAGGAGGSSSTSWQDNARTFAADSLQQLRDRTMQRASAVRDERSTVIQTVGQGETVRAQTEVVANYNHCHAVTVEYFEVLRHFLVSQELFDVRECLFVPLPIGVFDRGKARRWREPLRLHLRQRDLSPGFLALDRIARNWDGWDFPEHRYSEEAPDQLEGELRISFLLPRPRDAEDGKFQISAWEPFRFLLPVDALELWTAQLAARTAADRDRYFRREVAPRIAERLVQRLRFAYVTRTGAQVPVSLDGTLVSRYAESVPLYVSLRPAGPLPPLAREEIQRFRIWYDGPALPPGAKVIVHSGRVRYRTPHLSHLLFDEPRLLNDLDRLDDVVVPTPLARAELRHPRREDQQLADRLVQHLNQHLEYYHQVIFALMDSNRRYLLLDGILAPGAGGRSVASVVENRLVGIVGNSLVMPLAPGNRLEPLVKQVDAEGEPAEPPDLIHLYASDRLPPIRVAVPTRGVYAEAIRGECNSCEGKDDARFWRWEESPVPDDPTAIVEVSTETRATPEPDLTPTPLPQPIVNIQNAPELPDPVGLRAAFQLLARNDLFKDITGLEGNQRNALASFQGALETAKFFGGKASELAQQNEAARSVDRTLAQIEQARNDDLISQTEAQDLAHAALSRLVGESSPGEGPPTDEPAVSRAIDAAVQSDRGQVTVTTPSGTVDASFEGGVPPPALGSGLRPKVDNFTQPVAKPVVFQKYEQFEDTATIPGKTLVRLRTSATVTASRALKVVQAIKTGDVASAPNLLDAGFVAKDPANPDLFRTSLKIRITYPEDSAHPGAIAGTGRLPVVVMVHGQHASYGMKLGPGGKPFEIPNHEGYWYLQDELALRGIVSASINTNLANRLDCLAEERANLVMEALAFLRELDGKAGKYKGRLNLGNVGLMGHSRGGEAVALAAKKNQALERDARFGIRAICSLAPSDFGGMTSTGHVDLKPEDTDFYVVLYGTLDGDVTGIEPLFDKSSGQVVATAGGTSWGGTGFRLYDRASCAKAMIFAKNFCHARFNTIWSVEPTGGPHPPAPGAKDDLGIFSGDKPRLKSHQAHRDLAVKVIGGLFRWKLGNEAAFAGLFNGTTALGVDASLQWSFGEREVVDDFEPASKNNLGGTRTVSLGSRVALAASQTGPRPFFDLVPHQTTVLVVDLTSAPSGNLSLVEAIPDTKKDWSDFKRITFRIGADYDATRDLTTQPLPRSSIRLTDTDDHTATVADTDYLALPTRPDARTVEFEKHGPHQGTLMRMETLSVPLDRFVGVDPHKIKELAIEIDPGNQTSIFYDQIQLVKM